jgi:tRNA threonylcarbamoyladenosine biosynthesis protein TsaB
MRGAEIIASLNEDFDEKRSEKLWLEIGRFLGEARISIDEVDLFAVCVGPGGFTGLRVGMAAALGLAAATGKPIIGISSLEAAAASAGDAPAVLAMTNAYRGEVYSQLFRCDRDCGPVAENEPLVSTFRDALDRVAHLEKLVFAGDAARENSDLIRELAGEIRRGESSELPQAWVIQNSGTSFADEIARLAFLRLAKGEVGSPEGVKACYVRPTEAEIKLAKGLLGSKIERVRRGK